MPLWNEARLPRHHWLLAGLCGHLAMVGTSAFILLPFAILPIISASTIKGNIWVWKERNLAFIQSNIVLACDEMMELLGKRPKHATLTSFTPSQSFIMKLYFFVSWKNSRDFLITTHNCELLEIFWKYLIVDRFGKEIISQSLNCDKISANLIFSCQIK